MDNPNFQDEALDSDLEEDSKTNKYYREKHQVQISERREIKEESSCSDVSGSTENMDKPNFQDEALGSNLEKDNKTKKHHREVLKVQISERPESSCSDGSGSTELNKSYNSLEFPKRRWERRMSVASVKKVRRMERIYLRIKDFLQNNRVTQHYFPPSGEVATTLTLILTTLAIFLAAGTVLGPTAHIGGPVFALLLLIVLALLGGKLIHGFHWLFMYFCNVDIHLPPLLGMLIVGILLKNVPYKLDTCVLDQNTTGFENMTTELETDGVPVRVSRSLDSHTISSLEHIDADCKPRYIGHDLDPNMTRPLRSLCLTVILLMAGLELDPVQLKKLSVMVIKATFIPCLVEATAVAVFSYLFLDFPWTVGFMLGFVLAAVSPAVIIPSLMSLSKRGYGVAKGIPTLVIAACSADDVVAISGFGIFMGLTFSTGAPLWKLILHGPIEVIIGVTFGVCWGILAQWIPNQDHHHVAFFRWLILTGGGLIALFGAHMIHYDGAGGLAAIIMAFVASIEWRKEGWDEHNPVVKTFHRMWIILEPVIFALIGTEIQIDKINPETLGKSIGVLLLALILRLGGTYLAVSCGGLNKKEKIFMAFAWMPKATVQAALGPIFLDKVLAVSAEEWGVLGDKDKWVGMGNDILTLAVLSILITAPLGSVLILALGSRLLETDKEALPLELIGRRLERTQSLREPRTRRMSVTEVNAKYKRRASTPGFVSLQLDVGSESKKLKNISTIQE